MLKYLISIALVLTGLKWGGVVTWSWAAIWAPTGVLLGVVGVLLVVFLVSCVLAVAVELKQRKRK